MVNKRGSKQAQVTIFVIIALVIVVAIGIVFAIKKMMVQSGEILADPKENPKEYVRGCTRIAMKAAEKNIMPKGGFSNPTEYIFFNKTKISWLCYTQFEKQLCINQHPALGNEIEKEIKTIILPEVKKCFDKVKSELSQNNYQEGELTLEVSIEPKKIIAKINKKITYTSNSQQNSIETFDTSISSPTYDFVRMSMEIVNTEVSCSCSAGDTCNADVVEITRENPAYELRKFITGDSEEIYTIKEIATGKEFNAAIRNCVPKIP